MHASHVQSLMSKVGFFLGDIVALLLPKLEKI